MAVTLGSTATLEYHAELTASMTGLSITAGQYVVLTIFHARSTLTVPMTYDVLTGIPDWLVLLDRQNFQSSGFRTSSLVLAGFAPSSVSSISWSATPGLGLSYAALSAWDGVLDPAQVHFHWAGEKGSGGAPETVLVNPARLVFTTTRYNSDIWAGSLSLGSPTPEVGTTFATRHQSRVYDPGATGVFTFSAPLASSFATGAIIILDQDPPVPPPPPAPSLNEPVRVSLSESIGGVFVDARIEVTYFPMVPHTLGELHAIGHELDPETPLYTFTIASRRESGALITYEGETIVAQLNRVPATIPVQLLPGDAGISDPMTPAGALEAILSAYGVPHEPLPPLLLRSAGIHIELHLDAFVYQPEDDPIMLLELLEQFLQPFRGYTTRATAANALEVVAPHWAVPRVDVGSFTHAGEGDTNVTDSIPWPLELGAELPVVEIRLQGTGSRGEAIDQTWDIPLQPGVQHFRRAGGSATEIYVVYDGDTRTIEITCPQIGSSWSEDTVTITATRAGEGERLDLTQEDLGLTSEVFESSDRVINAMEVTVQGWTFQDAQPLLALSGVLLRAGPSSWRMWYGTMNLPAMTTPEDLSDGAAVELLNETLPAATPSNSFPGTAYTRREVLWPIDTSTTVQPGSSITVDYAINVYGYYWSGAGDDNLATMEVTGTVTLPQNGQMVVVWEGSYDRHPGETSIGERGRGRVLAEYRAADRSILLTIEHQPYGRGWYSPGFLSIAEIFYMHALEVLVLGSGRTWVRNPNATVVRFGYAQEDRDAVPGLGESQARYQLREERLHLGWFDVPAAAALAIARAGVEYGYNPRREYSITIEPTPDPTVDAGYRLLPPRVGRAANLPESVIGSVKEWSYDEAHTPGTSGSGIAVTLEAEEILAHPRAARRHYGRAKYGISRYQQED